MKWLNIVIGKDGMREVGGGMVRIEGIGKRGNL